MANKIKNYDGIKAENFVTPTSRYVNSDVVYYGDQNMITFSTYKKFFTQTSTNDRFTVVNGTTEYRPDLISYQEYGVPDFWWRIMEVNNIKDIFDFKSGTNIRLPVNIY